MKILMFGMSSYPGGIENYIYNYFVAPDFQGRLKIDFVTYEESIAFEEALRERRYNIYHVPHLKKNPIGYYRCISRLVKSKQYDCIYVNMLTAANVLPVYLGVRYNIKNIALHAHANSTVKGIFRKTLHYINKKYCRKKAKLCLACSKEAGRWLFDSGNYFVIPNAIDCNRFRFDVKFREEIRNALQIKDEEFVIGHVGRLAEEKNHIFMLEILKDILRMNSNVKMVFVGEGAMKDELERRVFDMRLEDNVIFYGTSSETHKVYSAFDCFLFPSTFEGFGMAVLEAQSCGLKCYCSAQLSPALDVTNTVEYLDLNSGAEKWAEVIMNNLCYNIEAERLNKEVLKSDYNIEVQIENLMRLLYEYK